MPRPRPVPRSDDGALGVTFLGHGAERTGPPIYLARVLEVLRHHPSIRPEVVLLEGGPLLDTISDLAPTWVLDRPHRGRGRPRGEVVVVNTAGSIRALPFLGRRPHRLVSHVHELSTGFEFHLTAERRHLLLTTSDEVWTVADAVTDYLVQRHGLDADRVRCHRGVLPDDAFDAPDDAAGAALRAGLGIAPDAVLLGASGTLDWRKAPDLFVRILAEVERRTDRPVHAAWFGGSPDGPWARHLRAMAAGCGLTDRVHLVPEQDRPDRSFPALDLFVLPSREDAYPLVCLEAAAAGVPLVCFTSGGAPELAAMGAGITVPYPDVRAFAEAVADLLADEPRRRVLADGARRAALAHRASDRVPDLVADLHRVAGGPP